MRPWHVIVVYDTLAGRAGSWAGIVQADDVESAYELGCLRAKRSRPRLGQIRGGDVRPEGAPVAWRMTHPVRAKTDLDGRRVGGR